MPEFADLLERESRRVAPSPGGFERLARRRGRRERNRRIGAGLMTLVVIVAVAAAVLRANQSTGRPATPWITASPATSPTASPVTFPGMPPEGTKPSAPVTGTLVISYMGPDANGNHVILSVYDDGRRIWQRFSPSGWPSSPQPLVTPTDAKRLGTVFVWQRLTPEGVNRLRSTTMATGLFARDASFHSSKMIAIRVRDGDRLLGVSMSPYGPRNPTSAQIRALNALRLQLADPAAWLPGSDWVDTRVQPFVQACYSVATERGAVDLTKLPPAARAELSKHLHGTEGVMSTDDARTLAEALVSAGYAPTQNTPAEIGFDLPPGSQGAADGQPFEYLHLNPQFPNPQGCDGVG
jgi:hypothetical protein